MTNDLQRQLFARPSSEPDPNRSEANSTAQAQHDASSNRTHSVAAASTRGLTPEPSSARRGTPGAASSSAGSSQQERPTAEDILRDLIKEDTIPEDEQSGQSRAKRPREDEAGDEPSSKRDKIVAVDQLGEELEKLEREATHGITTSAIAVATTTTPEPRRQQELITPPDSNGTQGPRRILAIRSSRGRPSLPRNSNQAGDEDIGDGTSSGDETYRPPANPRYSPRQP